MVVQPWTKCFQGQQCPDVLLCTKYNGYTSSVQQHRMKHTPQGTIALPKSQSTANRPQQAQQVKGKGLKGSKQPDAPQAPATIPTRTRPRYRWTSPNTLERLFPTSSKQLAVNSTPWRPSTHPYLVVIISLKGAQSFLDPVTFMLLPQSLIAN